MHLLISFIKLMFKVQEKTMIPKDAILRVVRLTDNLKEISQMYCKALGLEVLAQVEDQDKFDGVVLGHPKHAYHIEFSRSHGMEVGKALSQDNLLVFYLPCSREWERTCRSFYTIDNVRHSKKSILHLVKL